MPISMDRLIFEPAVSVITKTLIVNPGLEDAIIQIGGEEIAVTNGTPLNELVARIARSGEEAGGTGDDIAEFAGRQCYRSWAKGREQTAYIENILGEAHGSVFEHAHVGFQITGASRSYSHEQIRHSVGTGVSQESQRFVNAEDIMFVVPPLLVYHVEGMSELERLADEELTEFRVACNFALASYISLRDRFIKRLTEMQASGASPKAVTSARKRALEAARAVLPNAAETRLVYTTNLRALRHIILQRGVEVADLEIRRVAVAMLRCARDYAPVFFADMVEDVGTDGYPIVRATWGRC